MNKLTDLIKLKNDIVELISKSKEILLDNNQMDLLESLKNKNSNISNNNILDNFIQKYKIQFEQNNIFINELKQEVSQLTVDIDLLADNLFNTVDQQELFSEINIHQTLDIKEEQTHIITICLGSNCDFRYPGLIFYPREKKWLKSLVACDPLYIVYNQNSPIDELINDFSNIYRSRLRQYLINDQNFSCLPQNQFGFILLWDWLTYLSFNNFEKYFNQIFNLLRPGGKAIINYNNCDLYGSAKQAECGNLSYSNARLVADLANRIGFKIIKSVDLPYNDAINTHLSWIEIQKPGTLSTVKAQQALATIIIK